MDKTQVKFRHLILLKIEPKDEETGEKGAALMKPEQDDVCCYFHYSNSSVFGWRRWELVVETSSSSEASFYRSNSKRSLQLTLFLQSRNRGSSVSSQTTTSSQKRRRKRNWKEVKSESRVEKLELVLQLCFLQISTQRRRFRIAQGERESDAE